MEYCERYENVLWGTRNSFKLDIFLALINRLSDNVMRKMMILLNLLTKLSYY